jgi:hypothetical protein
MVRSNATKKNVSEEEEEEKKMELKFFLRHADRNDFSGADVNLVPRVEL